MPPENKNSYKDNGISFRFLRENWMILVAIVVMFMSYQALLSRVQQTEVQVVKLEAKIENVESSIKVLSERMVEVKTIVEIIQKQTIK